MDKYRVGILGATGAVGQKFVEILDGHPWFEIAVLAASERSAGRRYREAANWIGGEAIPPRVADMEVVSTNEVPDCDLVFSGLSSGVAGDVEQRMADSGLAVISNARNFRMHPKVPLLIPEINPDHTALVRHQPWRGFIVTNPNCSTVGMVCALKPLHDAFGVDAVQVTTMQALSGAGYPGVSSLDALANVVPHIEGEEDKMATEPLKLLGTLAGSDIEPATIAISAQCNRVPVLEGHLECVSVRLRQRVGASDVREALAGFRSPVRHLGLPGEPQRLLHVSEEADYPQPRRHGVLEGGMGVAVGRIRPCEVLDFKLVVLVHNTIRGAAGGAVLNAELLHAQGLLRRRRVAAAAC